MGALDADGRARAYSIDGELIQGYLDYILQNTTEEDHIIGAYVDGELNLAVASWLETHGRRKMYAYNWNTGELWDDVQLGEPNTDSVDWGAEVVVCYSIDADRIEDMMGLSESDTFCATNMVNMRLLSDSDVV